MNTSRYIMESQCRSHATEAAKESQVDAEKDKQSKLEGNKGCTLSSYHKGRSYVYKHEQAQHGILPFSPKL
jgi:hypothetical protein